MSSLRRGHANLLCIVPIFSDDRAEATGLTKIFDNKIYYNNPNVYFTIFLFKIIQFCLRLKRNFWKQVNNLKRNLVKKVNNLKGNFG